MDKVIIHVQLIPYSFPFLKHYPRAGDIMTMPNLAKTFRAVAKEGHAGFYKGRIAQAIVDLIQSQGGVMELDDLAEMEAEVVEPIKYEFKKGDPANDHVTLWEVKCIMSGSPAD
jgi:gamma-glutamyltranspeptidase/glutathione hydrolase